MKKRAVCVGLAVLIGSMQIVSVSASKETELQKEKETTSTQLDDTYGKIDDLQAQKEELDAQISQLDKDLVNVMVTLNVLQNDITVKEEKIAETQAALKTAEESRDEHYKNMKERIQYSYEKSSDNALVQALEDGGLSNMLSKPEYNQQMYEYDQELLEKYEAVIEEVSALENQLEAEKAELEGMKAEQEKQQASLEASITQKEQESGDYETEIATAQSQADAYAALLEEQTAEIARLEEERLAVEQSAQRQAAIEAARVEAKQAAAAAAAQANMYGNNLYGNRASGTQQRDQYGNVIDGNTSASVPRTVSGSGRGVDVVNYALQFVGNPYVWGGTSLTNGADCSGFVQSVYAHFGVSLPRVSQDQMYAGQEVSYAEAQPGDLICYGDHIAIYMGNGQIVHASNSAPYPAGGIKISDNAAYRTILSVRRVI